MRLKEEKKLNLLSHKYKKAADGEKKQQITKFS